MKIVAIGISTGGPSIVENIVKNIRFIKNGAIIICMHMQPAILDSFVKRVTTISKFPVLITKDDLKIKNKTIYICSADKNVLYKNFKDKEYFSLIESSTIYKPEINTFFKSIAENKSDINNVMAIILSGIGDDGVESMLLLKEKGVITIASNKESSIVYGMPKRARELNAAKKILHLKEIIKEIENFLNG